MSSGERPAVNFRDLVEEAKKRIVFLAVCVVGMAYLMSLTSSSVLVNLPVAVLLIIILRYLSLDYEMRRKAATYKGNPPSATSSSKKKPVEGPRFIGERSDWKRKVNSPIVENAIDQFTRHIVSEWVTDLWYSRITPDRQGPEELVLIMNGVVGELASRMRNINIIDLLTRDMINILSKRLELFRACKTKIEKQQEKELTVEQRDIEIKYILAAENKLHPILFSAEAEHKVLQHVMDGLMLNTFKSEDLHCSLFRYITRELLACVVIRPVLNLASPRFINERIESLVTAARNKGSKGANETSPSKVNESPRIPSDPSSLFPDPSVKGVELIQLKKDQNNKPIEIPASDNGNELLSKDPLLSIDTRSTRSWSSLPEEQNGEGKGIQRHHSGGEWGDMLDVFSRRKTEALTPEHFDNIWTKGRDYRRKEDKHHTKVNSLAGVTSSAERSKIPSGRTKKDGKSRDCTSEKYVPSSGSYKGPGADNNTSMTLIEDEDEIESLASDEVESWSSSYTEGEDTSNVTGLDSPGVKVWDGKNKRNFSRIHHPLETFDRQKGRKTRKDQASSKKLHRTKSAKKRSRSSNHDGHVWQEVERTSFLLGEGQDLLSSGKINATPGDSSEDSEAELLGRIYSGAATSSSMSFASLTESHRLASNSAKTSIINDSFFTLRCEVSGANIVKSGSKTFAVYCISVTDVNNKSWSIKRRFQHFEELHRRLKEFPEYNLHLPPKHFLSTGLDLFVIQERCKLLDEYLKKLLQLPTISSSFEVWDFLSVDSQMYVFTNSLSIVETISADLDDSGCRKRKEYRDNVGPVCDPLQSKKETLSNEKFDSASQIKDERVSDGSKLKTKDHSHPLLKEPEKEFRRTFEGSRDNPENVEKKNMNRSINLERHVNSDEQASHSIETNVVALDASIPSEWVPPNLSVPILDLVDVILQLKDGGWIRRKAFWVAKQILQLGMGDAFDDWLIEKIQLLRQGSVVASGIRRLEQILWPDGIFITKHPSRQRSSTATPSHSPHQGQTPPNFSPRPDNVQQLEEEQRRESERRAKFVYELMIDKAPAAIVGLVGRKEYEQCGKDLYYFIQSSVCLKLLAFDLLELLLLSAYPELERVFRQLEEEKEKFGKLKLN